MQKPIEARVEAIIFQRDQTKTTREDQRIKIEIPIKKKQETKIAKKLEKQPSLFLIMKIISQVSEKSR